MQVVYAKRKEISIIFTNARPSGQVGMGGGGRGEGKKKMEPANRCCKSGNRICTE